MRQTSTCWPFHFRYFFLSEWKQQKVNVRRSKTSPQGLTCIDFLSHDIKYYDQLLRMIDLLIWLVFSSHSNIFLLAWKTDLICPLWLDHEIIESYLHYDRGENTTWLLACIQMSSRALQQLLSTRIEMNWTNLNQLRHFEQRSLTELSYVENF